MNGLYKIPVWNLAKACQLVDELQAAGLPVEANWLKSRHPSPPEQATQLQLKLDGKLILRQAGGQGIVVPKHLSPSQARILYGVLHRLGLSSPPSYGLGVTCAAVYLLLYIFVVMPSFAQLSVIVLVLSIVSVVAWIGAMSMLFGSGNEPDQSPSTGIILGLASPFVFMHAPGSLLVMPLFRAGLYRWLYQAGAKVEASLAQEQTDLHAAEKPL